MVLLELVGTYSTVPVLYLVLNGKVSSSSRSWIRAARYRYNYIIMNNPQHTGA